MGNCQAIDNATLVIEYPCGRVDKLYWPVTASEIIKMNPGHYVALLLTTTTTKSASATTNSSGNGGTVKTFSSSSSSSSSNNNIVRITRIKLLRPTDTLVLGHVYRLIDAQEVMRVLWAKKYAKMKKKESESDGTQQQQQRAGSDFESARRRSEVQKSNQVTKHERLQRSVSSANPAAAKSRSWLPSLQSISEATS